MKTSSDQKSFQESLETKMFLQSFEKPDKKSLEDKECLICLESLNVELELVVQLPCKCSSAVYHIDCIIRLLESGENKNFCPHCKTVYERPDPITQQQHPIDNRKYIYIFFIHILSNTIMNMINIGFTDDTDSTNAIRKLIAKIMIISYFCKILFNVILVYTLKVHPERVHSHLAASYSFQTILFILMICFYAFSKKTFRTTVILLNNIIFCFCDLMFRLSIECSS